MSLIQLRQFVKNKKQVTLDDIAKHFHVDAVKIESMMQLFIGKQLVEKQTIETKCSQCACCNKTTEIIYHWKQA
ncbi:MAG: hypothetical protein CENE_03664 [Candidatus Celerinatantimonas neptuna]|nr:MAG: hypothetical protein CENE_03664 [Candidatus Celerinatantimonas neptuna]